LLFVNDGSEDDTLELLKRLSDDYSGAHYYDLPQNGGKAEAVRQGMLYALSHYDFQYVGFLDADLAMPLSEISHFEIQMDEHPFDIVTGLRLKRLGVDIERTRLRHFSGRCFASAASFVLNLPVYDTQCGAKLYRRNVVEVLFSEPFITRWLFDVEILARYINKFGREKASKCIYECPIMQWIDVGGSKLKLKDFIKSPYELLKIMRKYHSRRKK